MQHVALVGRQVEASRYRQLLGFISSRFGRYKITKVGSIAALNGMVTEIDLLVCFDSQEPDAQLTDCKIRRVLIFSSVHSSRKNTLWSQAASGWVLPASASDDEAYQACKALMTA